MFEPIFKSTPPYLNKAGKNARQVQIRECFPQPLKERLDEGGEAGEGKRFRRSRFVFHRKRRRPRMVYGACYLKGTRFFDRDGLPDPLLAGLLG